MSVASDIKTKFTNQAIGKLVLQRKYDENDVVELLKRQAKNDVSICHQKNWKLLPSVLV
jgi:hypothetical protein